ncbi:MAG: NUDIX hydrolase, partial [Bacilli bacterium]
GDQGRGPLPHMSGSDSQDRVGQGRAATPNDALEEEAASVVHLRKRGQSVPRDAQEEESASSARLEVLLAKRAQTLRVLPGFMVFPGGVLEQADLDSARAWLENASFSRREPSSILPPAPAEFAMGGGVFFARSVTRDELYYSLLAAGLRELFEETGLQPGLQIGQQPGLQIGLQTGLRMRDGPDMAILRHGAGDGTAVRYFGRRVTPERVRYRFDTHYFVIEAPASAEEDLRLAESEFETALWRTPQAILRERDAGSYLLAPPTVDALTALCAYGSTAALLRHGLLPEQRDDDGRIDQFIAQMASPLR